MRKNLIKSDTGECIRSRPELKMKILEIVAETAVQELEHIFRSILLIKQSLKALFYW